MNELFVGTGVALVTPFLSDKKIDYDSLERIIKFVDLPEIDYLAIMGTTGESATLSWNEKIEILEFTKGKAPDQPILFGLGGNDTTQLLKEISLINKYPIDGILSVTPYYNRPSQAGLISHYRQIADTSDHPIILYNVPSRTGVNLESDTTLILSEHSNIMGIKEASGDLKQCERIVNSKSDNFLLLSGNDSETLAILKLGGNGSISVLANYKPEMFGNMVRSYLNKEYEKALKYQNELREYFEWMDLEGNPTSIKTALKTIHLCKKTVRSPLMEGSIDLENKFLTKK
jgi:4-hydroxy-tetrahydrodipicolinate synthase|tara:strand:- start:57 stop:920 length:864 start_codon:yes stop_codon:yes gene_type:complete